MSGIDSLCRQKPHCLSSRNKVEHIYQEKLHIEEPGASITYAQVYQKKLCQLLDQQILILVAEWFQLQMWCLWQGTGISQGGKI